MWRNQKWWRTLCSYQPYVLNLKWRIFSFSWAVRFISSFFKQQAQSHFKADKECPMIKPPNMAHQSASKMLRPTIEYSKLPKSAPNQQSNTPSFHQQKQLFLFCQTGPSNSKRPAFKSWGKFILYFPDEYFWGSSNPNWDPQHFKKCSTKFGNNSSALPWDEIHS